MSRTAAGRIKSVGPFLLLLSAAMLAAALISLCMGRYALSISEVFEILSSTLLNREPNVPLAARNVVLFVRLPRVMAALLVGAGLALSGATYQSIFKNPLAVPELLGVFQGSCVGAAIAILLNFSSFSIQLYALIGGITAVVLANVIMRFFKSDSTALLVLAGVIVSGLMSSILGLLKYWMDPETQLPTIVFWQMGSLADMTIKKIIVIVPAMLISAVVLLTIRWQFNLLSLCDDEARSLGVNVPVVRGTAILFSTLLTSCAVCLSGTISWIGLIIPHLSRIFIGHDNTKLVPVSMLAGAIFLVVIDTFSRTLSAVEIPLSILTGIVGAPGFILLIYKQRMRVR